VDDHATVLLNGVGTGFVERMNFGVVVTDDRIAQRLETTWLTKGRTAVPPLCVSATPGADVVRLAGELCSMATACSYRAVAERLAIEIDERVAPITTAPAQAPRRP
jgi:hypothetical protein